MADPISPDEPTVLGDQRQCGVCGEAIKKFECVHYGGVSCYSCRAFFRRLCQESLSGARAKLRCRAATLSLGPCTITPLTRKLCQKCRYDKCISIGMNPELVLTKEERTRRFWKRDQKQHQQQQRQQQQTTTTAFVVTCGDQDAATSRPLPRPAQTCPSPSPDHDHPGPSGLGSRDQGCHSSEMSTFIRHAFDVSSSLVLGSFQGKSVVSGVLALHRLEAGVGTRTLSLDRVSQLHSLILGSFANAIGGFSGLHPVDRADLLHRNAKLNLAYLMARYFTASNGHEQVQWLVGESDVIRALSAQEIQALHFIPLHDFIRTCSISSGCTQTVQLTCLEIKRLIREMERCCCHRIDKASVALALLFYSKGLVLNDADSVEREYHRYSSTVSGHCEETMARLRRISELACYLLGVFDKAFGPLNADSIAPRLAMSFTGEEDRWLRHQLGVFDFQTRSVPYGADILQYAFGVVNAEQVSMNWELHIARSLAVVTERVKRVLFAHQEFQLVDQEVCQDMCRWGALREFTTSLVLCQSLPSVAQQAKILLGFQDQAVWDAWFPDEASMSNLRKVDFMSINNTMSTPAHPGIGDDIKDLLGRLGRLIRDRESFQMITLISLFSALPMSGSKDKIHPAQVLAVRNRYLMALERKNRSGLSEIVRGVEDIDKLTSMFILLMT